MSGASPTTKQPPQQSSNPAPPDAPVHTVPLSLIDDGVATRQRLGLNEEHIQRLVTSIRTHGILVPLRVAPCDERYTLISGAHRREAAKRLHIHAVPVIVDHDSPTQQAAVAAVDNLDRRSPSPLEEAESVRQMHVDAGLQPGEIAAAINRSVAWVHDRLDLLTWPPEILEAVHHGAISKSAAAPLAKIERDDLRAALLDQAIRLGSSARTTSQWLATARARRDSGAEPTAAAVLNAPEAPRVIPTADCAVCGQRADLADLSTPPLHSGCLEALLEFVAARHHADALAPTPTPPPDAPPPDHTAPQPPPAAPTS